jgi:hypothetical protein
LKFTNLPLGSGAVDTVDGTGAEAQGTQTLLRGNHIFSTDEGQSVL